MISVLTQERLLGAGLGSLLTGVVVFEQRKSIYATICKTQPEALVQKCHASRADLEWPREPIFGRKSRLEFAHLWNKSVDKTLGPIIESLSTRGW